MQLVDLSLTIALLQSELEAAKAQLLSANARLRAAGAAPAGPSPSAKNPLPQSAAGRQSERADEAVENHCVGGHKF